MTGVPVIDILNFTISDLDVGLPWSKVTSHIPTLPTEFSVQLAIAAVDCVSNVDNRFEVYIRTQAAHLSALCGMLTLGGQLEGFAIDSTLAKLRDL